MDETGKQASTERASRKQARIKKRKYGTGEYTVEHMEGDMKGYTEGDTGEHTKGKSISENMKTRDI